MEDRWHAKRPGRMVVMRQRRRLRGRDRRRIGFRADRPERLRLENTTRPDNLVLRRDQLDLARPLSAVFASTPKMLEAARDFASASFPPRK